MAVAVPGTATVPTSDHKFNKVLLKLLILYCSLKCKSWMLAATKASLFKMLYTRYKEILKAMSHCQVV